MPGGRYIAHGLQVTVAAFTGRRSLANRESWRRDRRSVAERCMLARRRLPAGERSPVEELEATLAAIEASDLNCFSPPRPRAGPGGGRRRPTCRCPSAACPPASRSSSRSRAGPTPGRRSSSRTASPTTPSHNVAAAVRPAAAWCPSGLTTASEFGGLNVSVTKLNGVTHNPWRHGRTVGGSSGGSAAAVAGGLVSLATGGDGGGSIRIPAGYTGLLGMKGTFGRITRGPARLRAAPTPWSLGNLARSVRDAARYYDVCAGVDPYDPTSLPSPGGWEAGLGTHDLRGLRVAIVPNLGGVTLEPGVEDRIRAEADALIADTGMVEVDLDVDPPNLAAQWMMGNLSTLLAELGDRWPALRRRTSPTRSPSALFLSQSLYNLHTAAAAEELRVQANEAMAEAFERGRPHHRRHQPRPGLPGRRHDEQPRGRPHRLGQVAARSPATRSAAPCSAPGWPAPSPRSCPSTLLDFVSRQVPRHGEHGRAHDHLEHLRQPGGVDPRRHRRRPARRHAGARPPPRGRAAVRRRPRGRARAPLADGRPRGHEPGVATPA